jgi:hypothetical protein
MIFHRTAAEAFGITAAPSIVEREDLSGHGGAYRLIRTRTTKDGTPCSTPPRLFGEDGGLPAKL